MRRKGRPLLPVWAVFLLASGLVLLLGLATPGHAISAVDPQVLLFLFSMFVISKGLEMSGDLEAFSSWLISKSKGGLKTYFLFSYAFGLASAVIMNDSLAIMGTPIVLNYARKAKMNPRPLLYILAFAVSLGSAMTPIGNPQNSIIAIESGLKSPFLDMLFYVTPFSLLSLGALSLISVVLFGRLKGVEKVQASNPESNHTSSSLARLSLVVAVVGILLSDILHIFGYGGLTIAEGALPGALLLLLFSNRRLELLRRVEWKILLMFVGLFIYARGIYDGGLLSPLLPSGGTVPGSSGLLLTIIISSIVLSQVVSNVPAVILLMPYLHSVIPASDPLLWSSFAAASTLAGTLTLLGAASNLIVVEQAELQGVKISYVGFLKYGIPVTAISVLILFIVFSGYMLV